MVTVLLVAVAAGFAVLTAGPGAGQGSRCPPLPPPDGPTVTVRSVPELVRAGAEAGPGTTILVADGVYDLDGAAVWLAAPGVGLRSESGDRAKVVLDGGYVTPDIVTVAASRVTIADITLRRAYNHPLHIVSTEAGDTVGTLVYNVHVVDPGQQAIKMNPAAAGRYTDGGVIACSRVELTDAGRPHVRDDCYTGGVDGHASRGWTIRDNAFEGFWCPRGLSEHAVHMWKGSRDTVVERNVLRDNARGIGFGLVAEGDGRTYADDACPGVVGYVDHYDGTVRNNAVFAGRSELFASASGFDCGICLWQACGARVLHNTVAATDRPFSSIEWRFDRTRAVVANNLVTHALRDRGGQATLQANLEAAPLDLFADGPAGDLHLSEAAAAAIDRAAGLPPGWCDDDLDGERRPIGPAADIGADEARMASGIAYLPRVARVGGGTYRLTRISW